MPTYTYECELGHTFDTRAGLDDEVVGCKEPFYKSDDPDRPDGVITCGLPARRRPFYEDTSVSGLPTRAPILPSRPKIKDTSQLKEQDWVDAMSETAHEQYQYDKKYGKGGEHADSDDVSPNETGKYRMEGQHDWHEKAQEYHNRKGRVTQRRREAT